MQRKKAERSLIVFGVKGLLFRKRKVCGEAYGSYWDSVVA